MIDVNCKNSSTGDIVYNLYNYINSSGNDAAVCYGRGPKINEKNIFKFGIDAETYLHALLTRITGFTGCFSYFSTRRLIRFIKKYKPDVVHIHELHAYFVNIKPLLSYLSREKKQVIHTLHCEFSYTGKCGHSVECSKWKTECGHCPRLREYPSTLYFDHTKFMQNCKKQAFEGIDNLIITAPSKWLADRARQSFFRDRKICVVHNGVDTNVFKPVNCSALRTELGIKSNEKVVLALAPNLMSKEKGGKYVLQLAKKLENQFIRFVLVGADGESEYSSGNVIVKGKIYDKNLLSQYYSLADVFVICSERENFPTTCLEAQACGTRVCGFATGGVEEACMREASIGFAKYGDVEELSRMITACDRKTPESEQFISSLAKQTFGLNKTMKEYMELYWQQ